MEHFSDLTVASQFRYGWDNLKTGISEFSTDTINGKIQDLGKMVLGILEMVPVIGILPAFCEKKLRTFTIEGTLRERVALLNQEISSDSFKLQKLYFEVEPKIEDKAVNEFLGYSLPDRQIESYKRDLQRFLDNHPWLEEDEKDFIRNILSKSEKAEKIALYTSAIVLEPSASRKEFVKKELEKEISQQFEDLKDGEHMLIPAGYFHGDVQNVLGFIGEKKLVNGHSILLDVIKQSTGMKCIVYNAGAGCDGHQKNGENEVYPQVYEFTSDFNVKVFLGQLSSYTTYPLNVSVGPLECLYKDLQFYSGTKEKGERVAEGRKKEEEKRFFPYAKQTIDNCPKKSYESWLQQQFFERNYCDLYKNFCNERFSEINNDAKTIFKDEGEIFEDAKETFEVAEDPVKGAKEASDENKNITKTIKYKHSIIQIGGSSSQTYRNRIMFSIYGFFFGRDAVRNISEEEVKPIFTKASTYLSALSERIEKQSERKLPGEKP